MKSERRQESKTPAKAKSNPGPEPLETVGDYWRVYGNRVLLVLILVMASFLAVRYYNENKERDVQKVNEALATMQTQLPALEQFSIRTGNVATDENKSSRSQMVTQLSDAISTVVNTSKDPLLISRGFLDEADMNWSMANAPDPIGATTRPDLKIQNRDTMLNNARDYYSRVLESPYSDDALNVFHVRMGLAAIAENQGKWDEAKSQYEAIGKLSLPQSFKDVATGRISNLAAVQKSPPLTVAPETPDLAALLEQLKKSGALTTAPTTSSTTLPALTPQELSHTNMMGVAPVTQPFPEHATTQPAATQSTATQPAVTRP